MLKLDIVSTAHGKVKLKMCIEKRTAVNIVVLLRNDQGLLDNAEFADLKKRLLGGD